MENKITKKLIMIFGVIIFSLAMVKSVHASYPVSYAFSGEPTNYQYSHGYYDYAGNYSYPQYNYYYQKSQYIPNTEPKTIVNNYYQTVPATVAKVNTVSTTKTVNTSNTKVDNTDKTNGDYNPNNGLGASAYNGITALSLRGSGSFMPSSIWQWMLVIVLILVIIVISRVLARKPTVEQESHVAHTH